MPKQQLTVAEVLSWCDAFHRRRGRWPNRNDGPVREADLTWQALCLALRRGYRGLPGGCSLAELLHDRRGVRHKMYPPRLTVVQILRWADDHHARTGDWPRPHGGEIPGTNKETWLAVETALRVGSRGLQGGSSLARLFETRRGVRNHMALPPLTVDQILAWADTHYEQTGSWPRKTSGDIAGTDENWFAVNACLFLGHRGLPLGSSLPRLLAAHRGVRNYVEPPRLRVEQILRWADAHRARTGKWPVATGPIPEDPEETWGAVDAALHAGNRGLPGGDSLARFLTRHRGKRNPADLPRVTTKQIKCWMRVHRERTGKWPQQTSGAIPGTPGETWAGIYKALEHGKRGLSGGLTLAKLARQME